MAGENTSLDFSALNDAALEASINDEAYEPEDVGGDTEQVNDATAQAAADQESAAGANEGQQARPVDEVIEDGERKLVDLRALHESRELERQAREARQVAETELARYRQQEAANQAAHHDAQVQATYEQILIEQGEEAAAQYINAVGRQREGQMQAEFAERQAITTLTLSEEMVREIYPDYDERFARMHEVLGTDATRVLVNRALNEAPRAPAKWIYEQAKTHFPTPADQQASIQAEVAKQIAILQGKAKPPAVRGHQSIGHISSGTQNPGDVKPFRKMSDAELERSLNE